MTKDAQSTDQHFACSAVLHPYPASLWHWCPWVWNSWRRIAACQRFDRWPFRQWILILVEWHQSAENCCEFFWRSKALPFALPLWIRLRSLLSAACRLNNSFSLLSGSTRPRLHPRPLFLFLRSWLSCHHGSKSNSNRKAFDDVVPPSEAREILSC